ncbi:hypothetical protein BGZ61DRAFT_540483 [Ilyonectria robusta]|uniref:uncharacterized protein n=1 Tax=Ilyonectria robusta TaxID=1079257 RepID=UPI001E8ED08F|nr:uncharacterized protein BGZ61DRAFT_540483 [Ilyonectria robusta]KAH8658551.1 hypothetical protein BGZ61DRAFT_540483 [Ilyonectria robusta]
MDFLTLEGKLLAKRAVGEGSEQLPEAETSKRDISSPHNLISTLQGAVLSVNTQGISLDDISDRVQSGDLSYGRDAGQALPEHNSLIDTLTNFVTKRIGSSGLSITNWYIKIIHTLVVALVSNGTTIVKGLFTIYGIRT